MTPAFADGPTPCSVGGPPFPFAGFCATYSGDNTWYGSYGPGFPTDEGWAFCAERPASGGDYPEPVYGYTPSSPPPGANTASDAALGFAFSETEALGWWGGSSGRFTADQVAVAGKLLYDAIVWGSPVPSMDPGVESAYDALNGWLTQATGASGAPILTTALLGAGTSFTGSTTDQVTVVFPGTGTPVAGLPLQLSVTGAAFNDVSGPNALTLATDTSGTASVPIFASNPGPISVTVTVAGGLGQPDLRYFSPGAQDKEAQDLASFAAPTALSSIQQLTALPTTGTVSILKAGDDSSYYPINGAVFEVLSGSNVEATLTTGSDGTTPESPQLRAGSYVVHEQTAPDGYDTAADQPVDVVAGGNTQVSFTGADEEHIVKGSLTIFKQDERTSAPLAGAVFDTIYDSSNSGTFDQNLGLCTTTSSGSCSPSGNDGPTGLLPGRYQVTETGAPPGYAVPQPASQVIDLLPGEDGVVTFGDPRLVAALFEKVATGNVNPAELSLAGAVILVEQGSPGGPPVVECSTNAAGACMTAVILVSGQRYCWSELAAPPGLAGGASGCFTAQDGQGNQPITVSDAGRFVSIEVKKVDAANSAVGLPGAVFDLYRVPNNPTPSVVGLPAAATTPGEVQVGTTVTDSDGIGTFALQLPGYAYCAVEVQPPANYTADTTRQCTDLLTGTTAVPPPVTNLTFGDTERMVGVSVFKYNSLSPGTVIPGATYDLYVEGAGPPSGVPGRVPEDATSEPGDTWYARGTTGSDGKLSFTVPAGYAWCVLEVAAPPNYVRDDALHCSAVVTTSMSPTDATIAIPETLATVHITAYKYNSRQPDTVIPGATYELVAQGAQPPGAPSDQPASASVPAGDTFWAESTTDARGVLTFAVPAGYTWCLHEVTAPAAYQPDPAFHCTAVLTADSSSAATTVAVPETPLTGSLPFTGFPALWMGLAGGALAALGAGALLLERRSRRTRP